MVMGGCCVIIKGLGRVKLTVALLLSFGLAVDRGGDPSNQDLGLRKVLGELNAADLPFEPGSKRSRN